MSNASPKLVALDRVQDEFPDWPYSSWATGNLIRKGRLGCVRAGRRVFVTRDLLDDFVRQHTVAAKGA